MNDYFTYLFGGLNVRHSKTFEMYRPYGVPNYIFLSVKTKAHFTINEETIVVSPNSLVIIEPYTPYHYSNPEGHYMDDWFHFKCSDSLFFDKMEIPTNTFIPIIEQTNINLLVQELIWESNYAANTIRDENLSLIIKVLMNNVLVCSRSIDIEQRYSPYNKKLKDLRLKIQSYPKDHYQVSEIADSLDISVSYFQHLYKDLFGISFQKDLIRLRIEYARHLLSITNLPVNDITELCGYTSEVHFYRQFKKITGITPSYYRSLKSEL